MAFDKIVGVDGTTYQFPTLVRARIADNIEQVGSDENLAVIAALGPALATKSATTHNHNLADLTNNGIDKLGDVEIGVVGPNGIALEDKHTLQYEGSTSTWRNKIASGGVTVGDSRPATPIPGDAWFDSNDGTLYVYYADANTSQWVQVQANSALEGTILARLGAVESRATALEAVPNYSPNYVINGGFDIWQRGTSFNGTTAYKYMADRWEGVRGSFAVGATFSRVSAGLSGFQYALRIQRDVGNTSTEAILIASVLESAMSIPLAGKTVTLSFYARGGSNLSSGLNYALRTGTGTDQGPHASWTSETYVINQTETLTTSWTRYSSTVTLGSSITQLGIGLVLSPTGTAGANDYVEVTGFQLEEGSVVTPFRRSGLNIQAELAACQRYYHSNPQTEAVARTGGFSNAYLSSTAYPVTMRAAPTITFYSGANFTGTASNVSAYWSSNSNLVAPTIWSTSIYNINMYVGYASTEFVQFSYTANAEL